MIRFIPRWGEVVWSIQRSSDELSTPPGLKKPLEETQSSIEVHAQSKHQVIAPHIKPLRPLLHSSQLSELFKIKTLDQPQCVQLTAEVGHDTVMRNVPHQSPQRFTQQDLLYYLPPRRVTQLGSLRLRQVTRRDVDVVDESPGHQVSWRLIERSATTRGADRVLYTIRYLETLQGHWVLMSTRFRWGRPLWSEAWERVLWTPLPSKVKVSRRLSEAGSWHDLGWMRSARPNSAGGQVWLNSMSAHEHTLTQLSTRGEMRGAWLRWSAFKTWRELRSMYQQGMIWATRPDAQNISLNPTQLTPAWLTSRHDDHLHHHLPAVVRWRFPHSFESDPEEYKLSLQEWVTRLKVRSMPQLSFPPLPVESGALLSPEWYARTMVRRTRGSLVLWSPPRKDPLQDQPHPYAHWGVIPPDHPTSPQALNGQPLPWGSSWLAVRSTHQRKADVVGHLKDSDISSVKPQRITASKRHMTYHIHFTAVEDDPHQVRVDWHLTPAAPVEDVWGEGIWLPLAIPDQLSALWNSQTDWNYRARWWSKLPDRSVHQIMEGWRSWWSDRARRRGLEILRPHLSSTPLNMSKTRGSGLDRSQVNTTHQRLNYQKQLHAWWSRPSLEIWVPQLELKSILKHTLRQTHRGALSLRRVVVIDHDLLKFRCPGWTAQTRHSQSDLFVYHSAWEQQKVKGQEREVWVTTLNMTIPQLHTQDQIPISVIEQITAIDRLERSYCLTAIGSHQINQSTELK